MTIAKSTVANAAAEEKAHSNRTHMGTSQHGFDVNAQPEVLDHLREQMLETDDSYHIIASVIVRSRRFWNNSPECQNSDDCVGNLCGSNGVY